MPKRNKSRTPPKIDLPRYAEEHLFCERSVHYVSLDEMRQAILRNESANRSLRPSFGTSYEFFYPADPYDDDVIAQDYASDWGKKQPARTPLLKAARKRTDKELAHLTTWRITGAPKEKEWDWNLLSTDLRAVVSTFIAFNPSMTAKAIRLSCRKSEFKMK